MVVGVGAGGCLEMLVVRSEEALAEFKAGPGMELSDAMVENKRSLRAAKQRQKVKPPFLSSG